MERGGEVVREGDGEGEGFLGVGVVGVVGCSLRGMGCCRIGEFGLGFVVVVSEIWVLVGMHPLARSVSIEMKSSIWTHRFGVDGPYERIHLVEYPDRFFSEWFADLCDWGCEHRSVFDGLLESDVAFVVEQGREDLFAELIGECKE